MQKNQSKKLRKTHTKTIESFFIRAVAATESAKLRMFVGYMNGVG